MNDNQHKVRLVTSKEARGLGTGAGGLELGGRQGAGGAH